MIDFKKIDWSKVDKEKMEFFFNEAREYNNKLIDDLNSLNNKAFSLMALALPVASAVTGLLLSALNAGNGNAMIPSLIAAGCGMGVTLVCLFLVVFPRRVYRSEGTPEMFFSGRYYKADMATILSGGIASFHKYILHNHKVMQRRTVCLVCGIIAFMATPIAAVSFFLAFHPRNW
jgi:hypothetical protein